MAPVVPPPSAASTPETGGLLTRLRIGRTRSYATPDWPSFASEDWLARIMSETVTDRLHEKQGRAIARWTLTNASGEKLIVYLKRHFVLPRKHGILSALWPRSAYSPGWEELQNLQWAEASGLPIARVTAAAEYLGPWGRLQSVIAVEELTGMIGLHEAVPLAMRTLNASDFARWKCGLFRELARLSRELHRRRTFHKDLYFCHFYILESDCAEVPETWAGRVRVIDFHRMAQHRLGWQWFLVKDLAQLMYSSEVPGVTVRDRLRFWKHYREGDWQPVQAPGHWMRSMIARKYRLYANQSIRREKRERRKAEAV